MKDRRFSIHLPTAAALLLLAAATGYAAEPVDLAGYDWRSRINGSLTTGVLHKAALPAEAFDAMQVFPLDVHVADEAGLPWPAMIWTRMDGRPAEPVGLIPVEQAEADGEPGFVVKAFAVAVGPDGEVPAHNRVVLRLGGSAFMRRVEVWGGPDADRLVLLGSGLMVDQAGTVPYRNRGIDYPDTRVPFLAVRVFRDLRNPETPLEWRRTEALLVRHDDGDGEMIAMTRLNPEGEDRDAPGIQRIYLDAGTRNRPLHYLMLPMALDGVAFPVRVSGRNRADQGWRWVADAGLQDTGGFRANRIPLNRTDYRFLKVEIYHGLDQHPVREDIRAAAVPYLLVFSPQSTRRAYAYFGSSSYRLPYQDFVRAVQEGNVVDAPPATLGRRHANPARVVVSLSAYRSTLLRLGVWVIALLVAVVTARYVRRRWMG